MTASQAPDPLARPTQRIDNVYLSLPTVIGRGGVEQIVPLGLSAEEASGLRRSAGLLRETIGALGLEG